MSTIVHTTSAGKPAFVELDIGGRTLQIEHVWIGAEHRERPLAVFLHEGLGSLAMWKDFPRRLCDAARLRGLVYSRPGYGRSTPREPGEQWGIDFMHQQAHELLPALLAALGEQGAPWLIGHSDGGSIALLYAARFPVRGLVVLAPHVFVEPLTVESIAQTRKAYLESGLRERLARYHADPDSAFWGWNDVWLMPAFRHWNIEAELETIGAPLLAIQGLDDPYGTLEQVRAIARRVLQTRLLELPECGHAPHRDQAERVIAAAQAFVGSA